jgi:hypothetical protein
VASVCRVRDTVKLVQKGLGLRTTHATAARAQERWQVLALPHARAAAWSCVSRVPPRCGMSHALSRAKRVRLVNAHYRPTLFRSMPADPCAPLRPQFPSTCLNEHPWLGLRRAWCSSSSACFSPWLKLRRRTGLHLSANDAKKPQDAPWAEHGVHHRVQAWAATVP